MGVTERSRNQEGQNLPRAARDRSCLSQSALLIKTCTRDFLREGGGGQLEINAHAFVFLKAHGFVIVVSPAVFFRKAAGDFFESSLAQALECCAFWLSDVGLASG